MNITYQILVEEIKKKKSLMCVGLDADIQFIPKFLLKYDDPIFEFNKFIIDATHDLCIAYKPNFAFYEAMGYKGWISLKKTNDYIPKNILKIADAKRGDIGNTATYYAKSIFDDLGFDAVTVSPYMGTDSITPFLKYTNKWVIALCLTSNTGSTDFQMSVLQNGNPLFIEVLQKLSMLAPKEQLMFVVGATRTDQLEIIRKIIPDYFLLVPGVGKQGGDLKSVLSNALHPVNYGLIINSSRDIIYASSDENFYELSRKKLTQINLDYQYIF